MSAFLYGLYDSRKGEASAPFYVGVGVKERHLRHWREFKSAGIAVNPRIKRVFERHLRQGCAPVAKILAICPNDRDYLALIEKKAIKAYGRNWHPDERGTLCNNSIGGNGPIGIDWTDPEIRKNISDGVKRAHANDPTIRDRMSAASKEVAKRPGVKAARSAASTRNNLANWADESIRKSRIESMRGVKRTPTDKSLASSFAALELARTPEARAKISESSKARWQDPEYRARMSVSRSLAQKGKPVSEKKRLACIANAEKARAAKKCAQPETNF